MRSPLASVLVPLLLLSSGLLWALHCVAGGMPADMEDEPALKRKKTVTWADDEVGPLSTSSDDSMLEGGTRSSGISSRPETSPGDAEAASSAVPVVDSGTS